LWAHQWGPQLIGLSEARDITRGSPQVTVAVLDTGVDWRIPDIAAHVWNENDRHGYNLQAQGNLARCVTFINAALVQECVQFFQEDERLLTPMDVTGHGTHVAGIIGAIADNDEGIAGMAQVTILPIKVLASATSTLNLIDIVATGIVIAVQEGADVINMSLGGCGAIEPLTIQAALEYAWRSNVVVVASAGNEANDVPCWPAADSHVISVAATNQMDQQASFSNFGPTIDLAAPGVDVLSTRSRWIMEFGLQFTGGGYWELNGTSMAAPHIAGVAALMLSANPNLSNEEIRNMLEATAVDLGQPGRDDVFGWGRVDARAAVVAAREV
jgi:subtilisin family serine protease